MRLEVFDPKLLKRRKKMSDNRRILEEFHESNMACAIVHDWEGCSANSKAYSLRLSAERYGYLGTTAISRNGNVYLIREELLK